MILKQVAALSTEPVPLAKSSGRVLAKEIKAPHSLPPFTASAMDGYALRVSDAKLGEELMVSDEVPAGRTTILAPAPGKALRIFTGGEVPSGLDAVIKQEDIEDLGSGRIRLNAVVQKGENVRRAGEEAEAGTSLLSRGSLLTPPRVGLIATMGIGRVEVFRNPSVAVLPTGNEIVEVTDEYQGAVTYNSNAIMLRSALEADGCDVQSLPVVPDHRALLREALIRALESDIVITTGGVSVGAYDYVREELEALGVEILFHKLAIKPGKPVLCGIRRSPRPALVFGLPGNPVSAMVTYELFVLPALRKMKGLSRFLGEMTTAILKEDLHKKKGLTHFVRGIAQEEAGALTVRSTGPQDSHMLTSLANANVLIVLEQDVENVRTSEKVPVYQWMGGTNVRMT